MRNMRYYGRCDRFGLVTVTRYPKGETHEIPLIERTATLFWGNTSEGSRRLATLILVRHFGVLVAELGADRFTADVVAKWTWPESWVLTDDEIKEWLRSLIDRPSELERVIAGQRERRPSK